jgi:hypothetical protein
MFRIPERREVDHTDALMQQTKAENTDKVWIKLCYICYAYLAAACLLTQILTFITVAPNPRAQ